MVITLYYHVMCWLQWSYFVLNFVESTNVTPSPRSKDVKNYTLIMCYFNTERERVTRGLARTIILQNNVRSELSTEFVFIIFASSSWPA